MADCSTKDGLERDPTPWRRICNGVRIGGRFLIKHLCDIGQLLLSSLLDRLPKSVVADDTAGKFASAHLEVIGVIT